MTYTNPSFEPDRTSVGKSTKRSGNVITKEKWPTYRQSVKVGESSNGPDFLVCWLYASALSCSYYCWMICVVFCFTQNLQKLKGKSILLHSVKGIIYKGITHNYCKLALKLIQKNMQALDFTKSQAVIIYLGQARRRNGNFKLIHKRNLNRYY